MITRLCWVKKSIGSSAVPSGAFWYGVTSLEEDFFWFWASFDLATPGLVVVYFSSCASSISFWASVLKLFYGFYFAFMEEWIAVSFVLGSGDTTLMLFSGVELTFVATIFVKDPVLFWWWKSTLLRETTPLLFC